MVARLRQMASRPVLQRAALGLAKALAAYAAGTGASSVGPVAAAPMATPAAPGMGPVGVTPRNMTAQHALASSVDALFGRVSYRLGPTNPRWSTFQGELSPETILNAVEMANQGFPFQLQDMYRRAVENDGHLGGVVEQRIGGIITKPDRSEPPGHLSRDPVALSNAAWQRAVREQVADFDDSRYSLLWADGAGYAAAENIYGWRRVIWYTASTASTKSRRIARDYLVPVKLETVDARSFKFDMETDEPLLWLQGDYITLPPAKFVFHRAFGLTSLTERRGFMRSCLWLSAMKGWSIRDMNEFLAAYGLPQMIAEYDSTKFSEPEAREIARVAMQHLGNLEIPLTPQGGFNLRNDTPQVAGALVHRDAANFFNGEITKRVTLGPLTMESGSGYGLGDIHAEGALDGKTLSAQKMCDAIRTYVWRPAFELNQYRLAADLGVPPEEILACLPTYSCRILREDTPQTRQAVLSQAMIDGCTVSKAQYRHDLHIDEPKDPDDVMKGVGTSIPSSGAVVGATDASKGEQAPPPQEPVTGGKPPQEQAS